MMKKVSLTESHPQIAAQLHRTLNAPLTADDVTAGSKRKVMWECPTCHQVWRAEINKRTRANGTDCPYCNHKRPIVGTNDLATLHPELAEEWDEERNGTHKPQDYLPQSNKRIGWICRRCGCRWVAAIYSRTSGTGCPREAQQVVVAGENDLATLRPDLAEEWEPALNDGKAPEQYTIGANIMIQWTCRHCGNNWHAPIYSRTKRRGTCCPYCAGKKPLIGVNDLLTKRPDLAAEWDYMRNNGSTPEDYVWKSEQEVYWLCSTCCYSWSARICSRTRPNGSGCPCCAGAVVVPGKNDLQTLRPDLAAEWSDQNTKKPSKYTVKSGERVMWRCATCGQTWSAIIANRTRSNGSKCPYCMRKRPSMGINDLATTHPAVAVEWDYDLNDDRPEDYLAGSGKVKWWRCDTYGVSWPARIQSRTRGTGCPYCSGRRPISNKTDLATLRPDLVSQWDTHNNGSLTPDQVGLKSERNAWWICDKCGCSYQQKVAARVSGKVLPCTSHRSRKRSI